MMLLEGVSLFGLASRPDGIAFRYKLLGVTAPEESYNLVLEVTNVLTSYIAKFSLKSLIERVEKDSFVEPNGRQMLDLLRKWFGDGTVEACVRTDGLQLEAVPKWDQYDVIIRLPPQGPIAPLPDAKSTAWVAQEVLFSMGEQLHETKQKLEACEQRCPALQQLEDITTFLAANQAQVGVANGSNGAAAAASPEPPRVSLVKRKQPESQPAPASGSAVKATRPTNGSAAGVAASKAAATSGEAGMPAASEQGPASTQQTGGMSTQSRRTAEVGQPAPLKKAKPAPLKGRGAGRGAGVIHVGRRK